MSNFHLKKNTEIKAFRLKSPDIEQYQKKYISPDASGLFRINSLKETLAFENWTLSSYMKMLEPFSLPCKKQVGPWELIFWILRGVKLIDTVTLQSIWAA